jgi:hypothetical protein
MIDRPCESLGFGRNHGPDPDFENDGAKKMIFPFLLNYFSFLRQLQDHQQIWGGMRIPSIDFHNKRPTTTEYELSGRGVVRTKCLIHCDARLPGIVQPVYQYLPCVIYLCVTM